MKTSHQLARRLLAGPDIPVVIYENADDAPIPHEVTALHLVGQDSPDGGDECEVIELYGKAPVVGVPGLCDALEEQSDKIAIRDRHLMLTGYNAAGFRCVGMPINPLQMLHDKGHTAAARVEVTEMRTPC